MEALNAVCDGRLRMDGAKEGALATLRELRNGNVLEFPSVERETDIPARDHAPFEEEQLTGAVLALVIIALPCCYCFLTGKRK